MPRPIPTEGATRFERDIWGAWREVIRAGWNEVRPESLRPLAQAFGEEEGNEERLRDHMLAVLVGDVTSERIDDLDQRFGELPSLAKARLILCRANPSPPPTAQDARKSVIALMRDEDPDAFAVEPDSLRSGRRGEWKILRSLLKLTLDRAAQLPAQGQMNRSLGIAAGNAARAVSWDPDNDRQPFWARSSTYAQIDSIAELPSLTIYAGSDGASDVGEPVHRELHAELIRRRLLAREPEFDRHAIDEGLNHLIATAPPAYLGSILRQLHSGGQETYSRNRERTLSAAAEMRIEERIRGGFLARSATYLAFAECCAERDVAVISSHLDDDFFDAAENRRDHYPEDMGDIHFSGERDPTGSGREIRFIRVHGRKPAWQQSLAIGEIDFEADPLLGVSGRPEPSRLDQLLEALRAGPVLFVGTSLEDSALTTALARTSNSEHLRFAVVMAPDSEAAMGLSPATWQVERWLLIQRYLHLGVIPIVVDYASQIPQFLREIASRIESGAEYERHVLKLEAWSRELSESCGITMTGDGRLEERNPREATDWDLAFDAIADGIRPRPGSRQDGLRIDLWLRNEALRGLVRVSSSDATVGDEKVSLDDLDEGSTAAAMAARAFRRGYSVEGTISEGRWVYAIAFNVIQYGGWGRLPVGVVTVLSDERHGALANLAEDGSERGEFEDMAGRQIESLLPEAPTR